MELPKQIFKSYDIRGIYPEELDEKVAQEIALLFLSFISQKINKKPNEMKIVIARDIRNSSESLANVFKETLISKGVQVDDLGLMSVDVIYFATGKFNYDGGVMVTASHNPGAYGGFKMVSKGVEWIRGIDLWGHRQDKIDFPEMDSGRLKNIDIWDEYLEMIFSFIDIEKIKPMKVVVDAGNGMAGTMIPKIVERLPQLELVPLFFEPDGTFPNRNPNPLGEGAYQKLSDKIKEVKADIGFIYDADADRVFIVDENGKFLLGDQTLMILSKQILERVPNAGIVYNLICSKNIPEFIEKNGGRAIRSEVGYVNIGKHMEEEKGVMGGEVSAHFSFQKNYYSDSGFIAFVMALQAVSEEGFKISDFINANTNWYRANEVNLTIEDKEAALNKIREYFSENILDEIDGITIEFEDWWFNVRPSNTEPLLRVTIECRNEEDIEEKTEEVLKIIKD
jgi:phosphomannomutase